MAVTDLAKRLEDFLLYVRVSIVEESEMATLRVELKVSGLERATRGADPIKERPRGLPRG